MSPDEVELLTQLGIVKIACIITLIVIVYSWLYGLLTGRND